MLLQDTFVQQARYYFKLLTMVLLCLSHWVKKSDLISSNMKEFHDEVGMMSGAHCS